MNAFKQRLKKTSLSFFIAFVAVMLAVHRQAGAVATAPNLLHWPYLQQVTSESAHIIWTTDTRGHPALEYGVGSSPLPLVGVVSRAVSTPDADYYEHKVVLTDLQPNAWYYYRILDNGVNLTPSDTRWFQTAPVNGEFTFAVFGDSGIGSPEQYQVRDQMYSRWRDIDLFLHTGDLDQTFGTYAQFDEHHFQVYKELFTWRPLFPTIGNHEYLTDNGRPYLDLFDLPVNTLDPQDAERYYSFDWGCTHFVSLDSEAPLHRISDSSDIDMADWLEADLASDDHIWKIATVHRPPYSSSPVHPEIDVRQKLVPIFEAYEVDLVLSGHNHNYERTHPIRGGAVSTVQDGGVVYIVGGGGGAWLYPVNGDWFTAAKAMVHHFIKVDVTKCTLRITAIDKHGSIIDRAVLDKCPYHAYMPLLP